MRTTISVILFLLSIGICCAQNTDSVSLICPSSTRTGDFVPVVMKTFKNNSLNYLNDQYTLLVNGQNADNCNINVKKGVGSISSTVNAVSDFEISVANFNTTKNISINNSVPVELSGQLNSNYTFQSFGVYYISSDLTINSPYTLIINEGVQVLVGKNVNIFVNGSIECEGSYESPVVFKCYEADTLWGGIMFNSGTDTSVFKNTFFIRGGGNINYVFAHSNSQAVLKAESSNLICDNCYLIDNAGKAFGSVSSILEIKNSLISRCDTGGEFHSSKVSIDSCNVMFIPDEDGIVEDDDNDGMYFYWFHSSGEYSSISNSFFNNGEDDAIDHNGANLNIQNCWIQGFNHEGIACSNANHLNVFNTLISNCNQAIEAGYGSPQVWANHCVFLNNHTGARFGDEYPALSEGRMRIKNSIFYGNDDNIQNFDPDLGGAVNDSLTVSYSITNDNEYNLQNSCISGIPLFSPDYMLLSGSPGISAADDGLNMGLISSLTDIQEIDSPVVFTVYPNPSSGIVNSVFESKCSGQAVVYIINLQGQVVLNHSIDIDYGENDFELNIATITPGLYYLVIASESLTYTKKIVIYE